MDAKSQGAVVQLVRMPACHAGGREFESRPHRREAQSKDWASFLLLMVEAERKIRVWGNAESAGSAETVGDNPLCINDLSICL